MLRTTKYVPYINELNFERIAFPANINDIPKFEKKNNIAVNVLQLVTKDSLSKAKQSPKTSCSLYCSSKVFISIQITLIKSNWILLLLISDNVNIMSKLYL